MSDPTTLDKRVLGHQIVNGETAGDQEARRIKFSDSEAEVIEVRLPSKLREEDFGEEQTSTNVPYFVEDGHSDLDSRVIAVPALAGAARGESVSIAPGATQTGIHEAPISAAHAAGIMGEQNAAFIGPKGADVIFGPGGEAGHGLTESGFDYLAFDPTKHELWIIDNKAYGMPRLVGADDDTAISDNLQTNVSKAIRQVEGIQDFPNKQEVLAKLNEMKRVLQSRGHNLPNGVRIGISNAGGYATGVSEGLQEKFVKNTGLIDKIEFLNVVGQDTIATRRADIAMAESTGATPGRSVPGSTAIEPEVTRPKFMVAKSLGRVDQGGWILLLAAAQALIVGILKFFPTRAESDIKHAWPKIVSDLNDHPDSGILIVFTYEAEDTGSFDPFHYMLTGQGDPRVAIYVGLTTYLGKSPDEAYSNYLTSPPLFDVGKGMVTSPRVMLWSTGTRWDKYEAPNTP